MSSLSNLTIHSIGGGWGKDVEDEGLELVAVIRGTDIPNLEINNIQGVPFRYETQKKIQSRLLQVGDLVIEISGGSASSKQRTGRCLYITDELLKNLGGKVIPASFCKLLRLDRKKVNSKYVYYQIKAMHLSDEIASFENQSTGISNFQFNRFIDEIRPSILDIEVQNKIVNFLEKIDLKIINNININQTLEQIAQTIFKSWFIDFDPVYAKANALASGQTLEQATQAAMAVISGKNTQELHRLQTANPEQYQQLWEIAEAFPSGFSGYKNLGEIPIGWNVLTFKDFISESKEKIGSLEDVPEYSVGNEGIYPRSEKYNKSLSKTPEKNKVVRIGDLVFGMGSKTLNWGIMNDEIGSVSPAYFVYRIFTNINYIYLNKYIKAKEYDFQNLIKPTSRQGQSVDKEIFLKKEIYVPNEYLLNIYLNKLKEIDSLVYSYTTEVLILEQIRDELLPKLLSGEI
ncbi:restriction endonuclease subunit S [Glaesserella parasuis]|nr:restriction endonuclease subunit S [Glaesserella parasuis]